MNSTQEAYEAGWRAGRVFAAKASVRTLFDLGVMHRDHDKPLPAVLGQGLRLSAVLVEADPPAVADALERVSAAFHRYLAHALSLPAGTRAADRRANTLRSAVEAAGDAVRARAEAEGVSPDPDVATPHPLDPVFARGFMDAVHDRFDALEF